MKTENAMQLKAKINSKAKDLNIAPQFVLQNYIMECFIKRISLSEYKDNFILKGGLLIASLIGLLWEKYRKKQPYAKNISFADVCKEVENLLNKIGLLN